MVGRVQILEPTSMSVDFIGIGFADGMEYAIEEQQCWASISKQIDAAFPNCQNVLISLTWFGPQFRTIGWDTVLNCEQNNIVYDNVFFLSTVDPPYLNDTELREVKNKLKALKVFYLGNFDSAHEFNFFAPIIASKFKTYTEKELALESVKHVYVNYNRKPKQHRVDFVKKLISSDLLKFGTVTLGTDARNDLLLTIGEKDEDYLLYGNSNYHWGQFGVPHDMYSLHRMDIWKSTFLYINAATEFNFVNDLFCQQDTFKPMIGLRPFVINGVQRTYRWLRMNGFRTFNHHWPHIDIENGNVHDTLIALIKYLGNLTDKDLLALYCNMQPDLVHNRMRFFEFAKEQKYKMENLFV
jgi:hypothetical protein